MYRPSHLNQHTMKLLYLSSIFIFSSITIFMAVAFHLAVAPLSFTAPDAGPILSEISFTAEVLSVDATARTMEMDWYPQIVPGCFPDPDFVADIFFVPDFLDASSVSFTSFPPFSPAYQLNTSLICGGTSPVTLSIFRTVIKLLGTNANPIFTTQHSSLQDYPFDLYAARINMYARDHNTGRAISLNVTRAYGVAVNFEVTPVGSLIAGDVFPLLQIDLKVGRSKAAKSFVVVVAISNWLVASAFLVVTAATIVYPNPVHYTEIFVLPIGVLFAFTSIRANLPGAPPGFGARIDLFTILPVLVVVTLCSFFLLLAVLYQRIFKWDKPKIYPHSIGDLESARKSSKVPEEIQLPAVKWTEEVKEATDTRVENVDISVEIMGARVEGADISVEDDETRVEDVETRVETGETRVEGVEARVDDVEIKVEDAETKVEDAETRVEHVLTHTCGDL